VVTLTAEELLRRWLQHVLPRGFVKMRHYGLLANRGRVEWLTLRRALLALWAMVRAVVGMLRVPEAARAVGRPVCPVCGSEAWGRVAELPRR
jgi:hypothetical protein